MPERRRFRLSDFISMIISFITLISLIISALFWFYKTNELPQRVQTIESKVEKLESKTIENSTKIDLIYQAVIEIRSVLLKKA